MQEMIKYENSPLRTAHQAMLIALNDEDAN